MPVIPRPVTETEIATAEWGIPITDGVNANSANIANVMNLTNPTWKSLGTIGVGWQQFPDLPIPSYTRAGKLVFIRGVVMATAALPGASGTALVTNMPAEAVPESNRNFLCVANGYAVQGAIVTNSRHLQISVPAGGWGAGGWTDLGMTFYYVS